MAHEVNQSEKEVAAQVRSALVDRISSERYDLWIPRDSIWHWMGDALTITFSSEFKCNVARKMLGGDVAQAVRFVTGREDIEVRFFWRADGDQPPIASSEMTRSAPLYGSNRLGGPEARVQPASTIGVQGRECLDATGHKSDMMALSEQAIDPGSRSVSEGRAVAAEDSAAGVSSQRKSSSQRTKARSPVGSVSTTATGERPASVASSEANSSGRQHPPTTRLWERFVQGTSNQLAWTTANLLVGEPGRLTPVLLHGPSGSGKSFLVAAVAQRLRSERRLRRVVHMTSEQFTNDFTEGLRGGGLPMFRRKYRDVDALLLEDVQFFFGKRSTLIELRHTVDNLLRMNKQVVLTADRALNELQPLGEELVGRLRGGLTAPMFPLDVTIRESLLRQHLTAVGVDVEQGIVEQLAAGIAGDGRVISGIAKRLMAVAAMSDGRLGWEQCWSAVCDLVQATQPVVQIDDIERAVCSMFGLESKSLQSPSKTRQVSQPRMLAMFLARKYTPAAYKEIGHYFGQRRHSTVISAEKTVESWLANNAHLQAGHGMSVKDVLKQVESQLQVG